MPFDPNSDTRHGPTGYHWQRPRTCIDACGERSRIRLRPRVARLLRALGLIAAASATGTTSADAAPSVAGDTQAVVELRQYTLHPGRRDTLIDLFEQHFIESQEQTGLRVIGQFRDLDDPDRFVWLRGFDSMPARKTALERFYGGPVWKAHREAANATMIDSDNVLLLRPAQTDARFALESHTRPARDAEAADTGLVVASIHYLRGPATPALLHLLRTRIEPQLREAGARPLASFVTETATNTFPALPVRLGESVLVLFTAFDDEAGHRRFETARTASPAWTALDAALQPCLSRASETLRLKPARRSLLAGR
jgi:quinol monooxygenase YgiN